MSLARKLLRGADTAPKVLTYRAASSTVSGSNPYTFSSLSIGTADAARIVHVGIMVRRSSSANTISGVTIGGVTATINVQLGETNNAYELVIASAAVPTGTTANVVVTLSAGTADRIHCGVWTSTGTTVTAAFTNSVNDEISPIDLSINTTNGGFSITVCNTNGTGTAFTWTNATERFEQTSAGSLSGADATTDGSSLAPSCSTTAAPRLMLAASW